MTTSLMSNKQGHYCADCSKKSGRYLFCESCEAKYIKKEPKLNYNIKSLQTDQDKV